MAPAIIPRTVFNEDRRGFGAFLASIELDVAGPTSPWVGGTTPKVRLVGCRPMAAASVLVGAGCLDLGGRSRGIA